MLTLGRSMLRSMLSLACIVAVFVSRVEGEEGQCWVALQKAHGSTDVTSRFVPYAGLRMLVGAMFRQSSCLYVDGCVFIQPT